MSRLHMSSKRRTYINTCNKKIQRGREKERAGERESEHLLQIRWQCQDGGAIFLVRISREVSYVVHTHECLITDK
jgi:hypothetical protein